MSEKGDCPLLCKRAGLLGVTCGAGWFCFDIPMLPCPACRLAHCLCPTPFFPLVTFNPSAATTISRYGCWFHWGLQGAVFGCARGFAAHFECNVHGCGVGRLLGSYGALGCSLTLPLPLYPTLQIRHHQVQCTGCLVGLDGGGPGNTLQIRCCLVWWAGLHSVLGHCM